MNADIVKERASASFDALELTYLLDGGKERTERRRYLGICELIIEIEMIRVDVGCIFFHAHEG